MWKRLILHGYNFPQIKLKGFTIFYYYFFIIAMWLQILVVTKCKATTFTNLLYPSNPGSDPQWREYKINVERVTALLKQISPMVEAFVEQSHARHNTMCSMSTSRITNTGTFTFDDWRHRTNQSLYILRHFVKRPLHDIYIYMPN